MTNELIIEELMVLPEEQKIQVINYIRFLKTSFATPPLQSPNKPQFGFGKFKVEIAEDFDAPLEDFKEYM